MSANTFSILAGGAEGTHVIYVDSSSGRGDGGLMGVGAVLFRAFEVEFADSFGRGFGGIL